MKRGVKIHEVFNKRTGKMEWSEYPQTREDAIAQGTYIYQPIGENPCPVCGGYVIRFTISQICPFCAHYKAVYDYGEAMYLKEPKSLCEAKAAGVDYYWTGKENPYCGHNGKVTLRGKCFTCENSPSIRRLITPMHEQYPDMIIDYKSAKALGFKVYRTGEPCSRGHTGWRYISNRGCIDCKD